MIKFLVIEVVHLFLVSGCDIYLLDSLDESCMQAQLLLSTWCYSAAEHDALIDCNHSAYFCALVHCCGLGYVQEATN